MSTDVEHFLAVYSSDRGRARGWASPVQHFVVAFGVAVEDGSFNTVGPKLWNSAMLHGELYEKLEVALPVDEWVAWVHSRRYICFLSVRPAHAEASGIKW